MTTTNRAFIKVYRHDAVPSDGLPAGIDPHYRPAAMPLHAVEYAAATPALHGRTATAGMFATSIDVMPSAGQSVGDVAAGHTTGTRQRGADAIHRRPSNRRVDMGASTKRPLSAFIARQSGQPDRPEANSAAKRQPLRVGTTVASFQWPRACRVISQRCAADLDAIVERLLDESATERSLFGLVSLFPRGGCTTVAMCLAARLTALGVSAALIDGNFYHPQLATSLDVVPTAGWQEVLNDTAPLADSVIRSLDDQLDVIVQSGERPFDPLELAASASARDTAAHLRNLYDLALIDLGAFFDPRTQSVALELVRNMKIDSVVAVAGPEPTDPRDLATVEDHFRRHGCNMLGIIENRIAQRAD